MIHSYNQFHAAGHGTFFSGQLIPNNNDKEKFLWVYDCGSKRRWRMESLVNDLAKHAAKDEIDMLCISHFDGDHVNGLASLLKVFKVKHLFLPYLPFNKRLALACNIDLDQDGSTGAMLFALDPVGFLSTSSMRGQVENIVLVQGGGSGGDDEPLNYDDLPITPDMPAPQFSERGIEDAVARIHGYEPLLVGDRGIGLTTVSHVSPLEVYGGEWEFIFYNKDLPLDAAPVSGEPLANIQVEVRDILNRFKLNTGVVGDIDGWRDALRECYEFHFGDTSAARNDISLCLLSGPRYDDNLDECKKFHSPTTGLKCHVRDIPVSKLAKCRLLLTGDIGISKSELTKMTAHFSQRRWDTIHVMQIPHHGSEHSWSTGCAAMCSHEYSVFCVPDDNPHGWHPHSNTLLDLVGKSPLVVNYSNSLVYCFHVEKRTPRARPIDPRFF